MKYFVLVLSIFFVAVFGGCNVYVDTLRGPTPSYVVHRRAYVVRRHVVNPAPPPAKVEVTVNEGQKSAPGMEQPSFERKVLRSHEERLDRLEKKVSEEGRAIDSLGSEMRGVEEGVAELLKRVPPPRPPPAIFPNDGRSQ